MAAEGRVIPGSMDYCDLGKEHLYYSYPGLFTLMSEAGLEKSGVTVIQNNPHLALYGHGILIGTGYEINRLIVRGANRSTTSVRYPNPIWGYGILDIYNLFFILSL